MSGTLRYTIRPYDTIWMLAQVFNTTVDSIMELNPGIDPRNLQIGQVITIMPGYQYYPPYPMNNQVGMPEDMVNEDMFDDMMDNDMLMDDFDEGVMCDLISYFRMLWEQHVTWTRAAIVGIIHDLPETELITQRLLRNAVDFANAFETYYGEEAAQTFGNLMTEHIVIAAELVQAAKAGDNEAAADAQQRWSANADQIAQFLGQINPNWSTEDWGAMLDEHLRLLSDNATAMLSQNYEESINSYDDIEAQALEMADMLAEGVAMQFQA